MIASITHPNYNAMIDYWIKYRYAYEAGTPFVEEYLNKFSTRETDAEFNSRKEISYCPAHAKAAINDIKNAIFQRTVDITRKGGSRTYLDAASGYDVRGVDLQGSTMNSFIGREVLPELLVMGKIGVFIDRPNVVISTRADQLATRPYVYVYKAEDIRSWSYDLNHNLTSILLRDYAYDIDPDTKLPNNEIERYRHIWVEDGKVHVQFYNNEGDKEEYTTIDLPYIPFVIFEIQSALMTDVADYQIALLNLASSDMAYALKSNFPFYTEQFDPNYEITHLLRGPTSTTGETDPGLGTEAATAKSKEVKVGSTQGRRYPKGLERPAYIHPSSEPLKASMEKQFSLQQEIRQLVNLAVTNQAPRNASAESKSYDERGLEAGLSYIGLELEYGERRIAEIWAAYENNQPTIINYPTRYTLKNDSERYDEAKQLTQATKLVPSDTFRREMLKNIVDIYLGTRIQSETLETIRREIDNAYITIVDPEVILQDIEAGLLSPESASKARGYSDDEVIKAAQAHAERLKRIAISQSKDGGLSQARGINDLGESSEGKEEKKQSRDTTKDDVVTDKTRGKGRARKD